MGLSLPSLRASMDYAAPEGGQGGVPATQETGPACGDVCGLQRGVRGEYDSMSDYWGMQVWCEDEELLQPYYDSLTAEERNGKSDHVIRQCQRCPRDGPVKIVISFWSSRSRRMWGRGDINYGFGEGSFAEFLDKWDKKPYICEDCDE